jgi:hypothetical protein
MGCLIEADEGARKLEFLRWISPVGAFSDECGLQELWQSSPCGKRLGGACPTLEKRNSASGQLADGNDDMRHRYPGNVGMRGMYARILIEISIGDSRW